MDPRMLTEVETHTSFPIFIPRNHVREITLSLTHHFQRERIRKRQMMPNLGLVLCRSHGVRLILGPMRVH